MLDFKSFNSSFDFVIGVESAYSDSGEINALAFISQRNGLPFGKEIVLVGKNTQTKVRAFAVDYHLYVMRTDMKTGNTRIFEYYAPHGLLLVEASKIVDWHHQTHIDF
ncbi:hypothetical protein RE428_48670 (plasmid) [Marinobacter nanhaiticus D15-8W]|uniref:Uncharacterized protein n=1 Tax=Marinobacter nanhaiticus D15-8W TaxID=626887 RepID=N6X114_9GAMM|nr:hypothetical protein [Marinobacter nanhaiticus]ENO17122.1 hypothetical protein J057_00614 [Marinobacter nanhaiticus D15-8W]BES73849.1 hypothetical protein RE428_48670 [Marinobacter nanhaiticus D15-8W]